MNIMLATLGTRGDVQPYLALGSYLRRRGHDVSLMTGLGYDDATRQADVRYIKLPVDFRRLAEIGIDTLRGKLAAYRHFTSSIQAVFDQMFWSTHAERPSVIVCHPKAHVMLPIARCLNLPAIPSTPLPLFLPTREYPHALVPIKGLGKPANVLSHHALDRVSLYAQHQFIRGWMENHSLLHRAANDVMPFENGYDPDRRPTPFLHAYSPTFLGPCSSVPSRYIITGAWRLSHDDAPSDGLRSFVEKGEAPIYVGFGSMASRCPNELSSIVVDAVRKSGRRAVIAGGWSGLARVDDPEIHFVDEASHSWLFPRAHTVVHHGGAGTMHEALRAGLPSVVVPVVGDQMFWGNRAAALGVAPPPLRRKKMTVNRLVKLLAQADEPSMRQDAATYGARLRAEMGVSTAARAIETFAS
jgi:sterol 3beta-glucosyltransferase